MSGNIISSRGQIHNQNTPAETIESKAEKTTDGLPSKDLIFQNKYDFSDKSDVSSLNRDKDILLNAMIPKPSMKLTGIELGSYQEKSREQLTNNLKKTLTAQISLGRKTVALYGFDNDEKTKPIPMARAAIKNDPDLNAGITPILLRKYDRDMPYDVARFFEPNQSLTPDLFKECFLDKIKPPESPSELSPSIQKWNDFLFKNTGKLDIGKKIASMISPNAEKGSGWQAEARHHGAVKAITRFALKNSLFVTHEPYKNLDPVEKNIILSSIVNTLVKFSNSSVELQLQKGDSSTLSDVEKKLENNAETLARNVIFTAFLRQTSKLGLEFFTENNIPIVFLWTDPKGIDLNDSNALGTIEPYLKTKANKNAGFIYEGITFSEARKVKREEEKLQFKSEGAVKVTVIKVHSNEDIIKP